MPLNKSKGNMTQKDWKAANGYYGSHCCNNCAYLYGNSKEGEACCHLMKEDGVKDFFMDIGSVPYYKCNKWMSNGRRLLK
jgi:hypothetical protein